MTAKLSELAVGQAGHISGVAAQGPLRRRLLDMGIVPGERVEVLKLAPLGDPLEVRVKRYALSLRAAEAACVAVEVGP